MNPGVRRFLVTLLVVAAAAACVGLGVWQLRRAWGKEAVRAGQAAVLARPTAQESASQAV